MKAFFVLACAVLLSAAAGAQPVAVGVSSLTPNTADLASGGTVRTNINLENPASATGSLNSARFTWAGNCTGGAKIKVFRRNGDMLTMVAESAPINTVTGVNTVALAPALSIRQGDLIGISKLTACGNSTTQNSLFPAPFGYVQYAGDLNGSAFLSAGFKSTNILGLSGSGPATERVTAVIAGVGSTRGGFGANFKTRLQLLSIAFSGNTTGRVHFHQTGRAGTLDDPSIPFSVPAGEVVSFDDILETMGQTGIGSMTIVQPANEEKIVASVRVFDDQGEAGTSGFTEPVIDPRSDDPVIMYGGATGFLIGPSNEGMRINIGARALFSETRIGISLYSSNGTLLRSAVFKTLQPNEHFQANAATYLGAALSRDDYFEITVTGGPAIIFASPVDNVTNDPAIHFATASYMVAKQ